MACPSSINLKKYDYIIGVDPDTIKSGIAILNTHTKEISFNTFTFPALIGEMILFQAQCDFNKETFIVLVEAGWLNRSNWNLTKYDNLRTAASKGLDVGRNQEVGKKLIEMFKHNDIPVEEVKPLIKGWSGPSGKITHDEIAYFVTPFPKRSNQEERDAVLLCWNYASLPIIINCKPKLK